MSNLANSVLSTNTQKSSAIDVELPMTFVVWVQNIQDYIDPDLAGSEYQKYLNSWANYTQTRSETKQDQINSVYIQLLKDMSLEFTDATEQRFLSKLDFTNPQELDIAVNFFAKKLKDICLFFSAKREELKSNIVNKRAALSKILYGAIIDYANTLPEESFRGKVDELSNKLSISFEEMYDTFGGYYDVSETDVENASEYLKTLYAPNVLAGIDTVARSEQDNTNDTNAAFIRAVIWQLQQYPVVLDELGNQLRVNYNFSGTEVDLLKDQDFQDLLNNENPEDITSRIKYELAQNALGIPLWYLSAGEDGSVVSGSLIPANNPANNFYTRVYPTVVTTPTSATKTKIELGGYFIPENCGTLILRGKDAVTVDETAITPGSFYIFPDPEKVGNVTSVNGDMRTDVPILYRADIKANRKGVNSNYAEGDVGSTATVNTFHGYRSKSQNVSYAGQNTWLSFEAIKNSGYKSALRTDIYGNKYGKFQTDSRGWKDPSTALDVTEEYIKFLLLTGYLFENFDYSLTGLVYNEDVEYIRSGLTANTNPNRNSSNTPYISGDIPFIWNYITNPYTNIWGGNFKQTQFDDDGTSKYCSQELYCGPYVPPGYVVSAQTTMPDAYADNNGAGIPGVSYWFTDFYVCSLNNIDAAGYRLPTQNYPAGYNTMYSQDSGLVSNLKGGDYRDIYDEYSPCPVNYEEDDYVDEGNFIDHVLSGFETQTATAEQPADVFICDARYASGAFYFVDAFTDHVIPFNTAASGMIQRYTQNMADSLSGIYELDTYNDVLCIKTPEYLIFEQISEADGSDTVQSLSRYCEYKIQDNTANSWFKPGKVSTIYLPEHNSVIIAEIQFKFHNNNQITSSYQISVNIKMSVYDINRHNITTIGDITETYTPTFVNVSLPLLYLAQDVYTPVVSYNKAENRFILVVGTPIKFNISSGAIKTMLYAFELEPTTPNTVGELELHSSKVTLL